MLAAQWTVTRWLTRRNDAAQLFRWSLLGLVVAYPLLLIPTHVGELFAILPFQVACEALAWPAALALISERVAIDDQGRAMGLAAALRSLGMAIGPAIAGWLIRYDLSLPSLYAAAMLLCAWVIQGALS